MKKTYRIVLEAVDEKHFHYGGTPELHARTYSSLAEAIKVTRWLTVPVASGVHFLASVYLDGCGEAIGYRYSNEGFRRLW